MFVLAPSLYSLHCVTLSRRLLVASYTYSRRQQQSRSLTPGRAGVGVGGGRAKVTLLTHLSLVSSASAEVALKLTCCLPAED
jgi:hypothetical protein